MGHRPITEKFLEPNQRLAMGFRGTDDELKWVWARILSRETTQHRPFTNNLTPIAAGGTLSEVELKDITGATGMPLFNVTDQYAKTLIYHVGIGISPSWWIRCYPRYPSGSRLGEIPSFNAISLGSDYGYFTGEDSPYEEPTDAMEFVFPFGITADFGFANKDTDEVHQPVLNVQMRKYHVEILDPGKTEHARLIKRMADGSAPVYWFPIGPATNPANYGLKNHYGVEALTISQARTLAGGD